jgi:hypothetical protein
MERLAQHAFDAGEVMAYLDGELEARRAAELAAHLVGCSQCQEVARGFRALSERMLSFEVEHPAAGMNAALLAALDSMKSSRAPHINPAADRQGGKWLKFVFSPRAWALAGAAVVVTVVVIGILGKSGLPAPNNLLALRQARGDYKHWLSNDGAAAPRGGPEVFQTSSDTGGRDAVPEGAVPEPAPPAPGDELKAPENVGPMIVQTASLTILATNYDEASGAIEKLAAGHGGYAEKLDAKAQTGNARELTASLRIPTKQLDGFLADVRKLGHVEEETRSNEEVSDQYVDLQARLKSARATEQRLIELLGTRTGKLQDVLEAERELARIRGEIESMQGQSALLVHRVNYATVQVDLNEEYRQVLGSGTISTGTKIRNALVEGFTNLENGAVALVVFVFAVGPSLVFWLAILLVPGWFVWKRYRLRARRPA